MENTAELLRLIHNLIRLGTVHQVDCDAARCRVVIGELLTDWLPWVSRRAGLTSDWDPPTDGEQVVILAPGGDPACAVVLCGIFSNAAPAQSSSPNVWSRTFPDGAVLEYNHHTHELNASLPGKIVVTAPEGAEINGDTVINGTVTVNGNAEFAEAISVGGSAEFNGGSVTHNGTDIGDSHTHPGVQTGGGTTGAPL